MLKNAADYIRGEKNTLPIVLSVQGTDFQVSVWKELLRIPSGSVSSYAEVAKALNNQKAVRAVGTAIGANPIALFIPCHRVIRSNGEVGGYRWGIGRKGNILDFEVK
jgi:AraC family transcriptional regulator of adaptative response/methylated-DNA-[protein]-cysteine methyltransferase